MERDGIFAGEDPFLIAQAWLRDASASEPNDPNAAALATVDANGMPNVRMVLLKEIETNSVVFYTNYQSAKGQEISVNPKAAMVLHWKSLRRQIRLRGLVSKEEGAQADAYYNSRHLESRIGAWASQQSTPLQSRVDLEQAVVEAAATHGNTPPRPPFWGGFRIYPLEVEFWADGANRLHDRFMWKREAYEGDDSLVRWQVDRLNP